MGAAGPLQSSFHGTNHIVPNNYSSRFAVIVSPRSQFQRKSVRFSEGGVVCAASDSGDYRMAYRGAFIEPGATLSYVSSDTAHSPDCEDALRRCVRDWAAHSRRSTSRARYHSMPKKSWVPPEIALKDYTKGMVNIEPQRVCRAFFAYLRPLLAHSSGSQNVWMSTTLCSR